MPPFTFCFAAFHELIGGLCKIERCTSGLKLHPVVERYVHKNIRGLVSRRFGQTLVPKEWLREPMAVLHDFRVVKDNKILFFFLRELAKDPKLYRALSVMLI